MRLPLVCALLSSALLTAAAARADDAAPATDWPLYGLDYSNQRYSPLAQIDAGNVARLTRAWRVKTGVPGSFQATPIVRDGVMYVSTPFDHVLALDAATGKELWRYTHVLTRKDSCCGPANRGVAVDDSRVYIATVDARLVALDRANGRIVWEFALTHGDEGAMEDLGQLLAVPEFAAAKQTGQTGYSANMAPQVVGDLVLVGVTGAGYGLHVETREDGAAQISVAGLGGEKLGLRGFLVALDRRTGAERWRWYVTDAGWEGEFTATTAYGLPLHRDLEAERAAFARYGESWRFGGGSVWTTPAVDLARGLVYIGTGNPAPQMDDATRPGDNRHSISLVALELATGKLRWAYQQVPHDRWGYDVASPPVLFTLDIDGRPREVVAQAGKVGWLFIHDRDSGELLRRSDPFVPQDNLFARPTAEGVRIAPSAIGGCSWSPISIDLAQRRAYVAAVHWPAMYYSRKLEQPGLPWDTYTFVKPIAGEDDGVLAAIDLDSGAIAWRAPLDKPLIGGVLATAGKLVFVGESSGRFSAFDSRDGKPLWSDPVDAGVNAPPVTYAVGGRQYVAVAAGGNALFGFKTGDELIAYALPAEAQP
ncbi:MAG TPA: PQQ-binding-like beta-propeller repeat protein [Gammaproteobacteria bacterium]|nr:PQQ-binding-like beta-propeller repeat protein [Gammaproteobacteria bacterium]